MSIILITKDLIHHSIQSGFSSPTDIVADKVIANVNEDIVSPLEDPNQNANDPTIVFSDPINSATKLLYDLDVHVQQFVPSETAVFNDEVGLATTQEPTTPQVHIYSGSNSELEIALSRQGDSVSALVVQLDTLQKRIQVCFPLNIKLFHSSVILFRN